MKHGRMSSTLRIAFKELQIIGKNYFKGIFQDYIKITSEAIHESKSKQKSAFGVENYQIQFAEDLSIKHRWNAYILKINY